MDVVEDHVRPEQGEPDVVTPPGGDEIRVEEFIDSAKLSRAIDPRASWSKLTSRQMRRGMWHWLRRNRWTILLALAVAWLALGIWGYWDFNPRAPIADRFYGALTLFRDSTTTYVVKGKGEGVPFPWQLETARFLAPLTLTVATVSAITLLFAEQLTRVRIWLRFWNHTVVCGLGEFGVRLAAEIDDRGQRVVVIDQNASPLAVNLCRERFIPLLKGSAQDPDVLESAKVGRARNLICVCGDSGVNTEIGLLAGSGHPDRTNPLDCFIQIDDEQLCIMLEQWSLSISNDNQTALNFVNVLHSCPAVIMRTFPQAFAPKDGGIPHLVVIGSEPMATNIVVGAIRAWWYEHPEHSKQVPLTLIANDAEVRAADLNARFPHFSEACALRPHPLDGPTLLAAGDLVPPDEWKHATVFVACETERDTMDTVMRLANIVPKEVPIIALTHRSVGTTAVLAAIASSGDRGNVISFPVFDKLCSPEAFMYSLIERMAQALHQNFLDNRHKENDLVPSNPARRVWDALSETFRESNRAQARGIRTRLELLGFTVEPTEDWDIPLPIFTPDQIECMAKFEHDRWCAERRAAGWTFGEDRSKKQSPFLVPWCELPEEIKDRDRQPVRETPELLARFGMKIVPVSAGNPRPLREASTLDPR